MTSSFSKPFKPTSAQLLAARDKTLTDVIRPGLRVLFCGINPGLYSAAAGHHFARPGNRFWPALRDSGFTNRLFSPFEDRELLEMGIGITNVVARTTSSADELSAQELTGGAQRLIAKVRRYKPRALAVLGVGAFRTAFGWRDAALGLQAEKIGATAVWVLPNPSGLNAHYQPRDLARLFMECRQTLRACRDQANFEAVHIHFGCPWSTGEYI